jgi:hypothetical protein
MSFLLLPCFSQKVLAYVLAGIKAFNASSEDVVLIPEVADPKDFPSCTDLMLNNGK